MLDKMTFIIFMIKLLGIQIILAGIYLGYVNGKSNFELLVTIGSLIFAIGSNILLGVTRRNSRK